jgi:hypothetical protein
MHRVRSCITWAAVVSERAAHVLKCWRASGMHWTLEHWALQYYNSKKVIIHYSSLVASYKQKHYKRLLYTKQKLHLKLDWNEKKQRAKCSDAEYWQSISVHLSVLSITELANISDTPMLRTNITHHNKLHLDRQRSYLAILINVLITVFYILIYTKINTGK